MADYGANIVMQSIGYDQANQRALFDRLMGIAQLGENKRQFNDTMDYNRNKPKDLSLQEQILQDVMAYKQGTATPEQKLRLQSYADMEGDKTQYQADAYGNVRAVTSPNPIGVMLGGGGAADKLFDTAGLEEMPAQPTPMRNSTGAGDMLFETSSALPQFDPGMAPNRPLNPEEFEKMSMTGSIPDALPTLPPASGNYSGSPVEDIERGKERAKVEAAGSMLPVKAAEADIAASGKMAESYANKTGENQATADVKLEALNSMISELEAFGADTVSKLPGGATGYAGAYMSNKLNVPSGAAIAQGKLDSTLPMLMSQAKNLTRSAGEGTFTDADQKLINDMFFNETDSTSVKMEKYKTLLEVFGRARDRITGKQETFREQTKDKPGFKYIGVKK